MFQTRNLPQTYPISGASRFWTIPACSTCLRPPRMVPAIDSRYSRFLPFFLKKWFRPESWMLWAKFRLNPGPANSKNQPWNLKPVIVWSQHFSDSNWRRQDGLRTISGHQEEDHGEGWPGTGTVFSGQKKGPELPEPWPIRVMLREFQKITGFLICENTQRYTLGGSDFLENNSI